MILDEKQVDKLRKGLATLRANHNKPDMMDQVLKATFTEYGLVYSDLENHEYYFKEESTENSWDVSDEHFVGELINLDSFFKEDF